MDAVADLQFDLFAEPAAVVQSAPVLNAKSGAWLPPESLAISTALKRGDLRRALDVMAGLNKADLEKAMVGAGFAVASFKTRAEFLAQLQPDLLEAARRKVDGHGLRVQEMAAPYPSVLPTPPAPDPLSRSADIKYTHPDDPQLSWTGRGRQPAWVSEYLNNGGRIEDLAVDRQEPSVVAELVPEKSSAKTASDLLSEAVRLVRDHAEHRPFDDVSLLRKEVEDRLKAEHGKPWHAIASTAGLTSGFLSDPLIEHLHEGQFLGVQKFAAELPVPVSMDDIPASLATRGYQGTSHTPEKRGESTRREYVKLLAAAWRQGSEIAGNDAAAMERMTESFEKLRDGYRGRLMTALQRHSNCISSMITGPARFPVEQARKASDAADRAFAEASDFLMKGTVLLCKAAHEPVDHSPAGLLEQAQKKLSMLEKMQTVMREANKAVRSGKDVEAKLTALGLPPEHKGFMDFQLRNNNAEIRRMKERVVELDRRAAEVTAEVTLDQPEAAREAGVRVVNNVEAQRVQILFDDKPSEQIRDELKANGFRWSPKAGAWQRQNTLNGLAAAERLVAGLVRDMAPAKMMEPDVEKPVEVEVPNRNSGRSR